MEFIGDSSESYKQSVNHNLWANNKLNEMALKFCMAKVSIEDSDVCMNKFKSAFSMYN